MIKRVARRWWTWVGTSLTVLVTGIALMEFGLVNPWIYLALALLLLILWVPATLSTTWSWRHVRQLLKEVESLLDSNRIAPKRVITFDRSSAAFGAMLAQRLRVSEIVALPRKAKPSQGASPRTVVVGESMVFDTATLVDGAVVFVYHLRTGSTLEAGMRALENAAEQVTIVALFATKGGRARWPNALVVRAAEAEGDIHMKLPWMDSDYVHE